MTDVRLSEGDAIATLLRRWWILLLGLVVGVLVGFGAVQFVQPTYSATATLLVKGVPGPGTGASYQAAQYAVARAKSYPALIQGAPVLEGAHADVGGDETSNSLRSRLSADNPVDTPLVKVSASADTAQDAQATANSAARHLAQYIVKIETVAGSSPVIVDIAVEAGLPVKPTSPNQLLYVAVGGAIGFAAAATGALFLPARRIRRGKSPEATEEAAPPVTTEADLADPELADTAVEK